MQTTRLHKKVYVITSIHEQGESEAELNSLLEQHQLDWPIHVVSQQGDGYKLAHDATTSGADLVVVSGSDATISDVATGLYLSNLPLAILQHPSLSDVTDTLNLPTSIHTALEQIAVGAGQMKWVDMAQYQERLFLLRAYMSNAMTSRHTPSVGKSQFGILAMLHTALRQSRVATKHTFEMTLDGRQMATSGYGVLIANTNILGSLNNYLAHPIRMDDGWLDIFVLHEQWQDATSLLDIVADQTCLSKSLSHYRAQKMRVLADDSLPVVIDGHAVDKTSIEIEIVPKALRLFVPTVA